MGKNKKYRAFLMAGGLVVVVLILIMIVGYGGDMWNEKVKVGFILSGSATEDGWNGMHYRGMKEACEQADVNLLTLENIPEHSGQCAMAVNDLIDAECKMVVLSSYGYSKEVRDIVGKYPEIVFYANSSEYHEKNMTSYFARVFKKSCSVTPSEYRNAFKMSRF